MAAWAWAAAVRRRKSVTLDANGNGSVMFAVPSANHRYRLTDIVASTSQAQTTAPYPQVVAFLDGNEQAGQSEGGSWLGNQVTLRGRIDMDSGTDLTVGFFGGVPGSVGTVVIEGEADLWQ